jgi:integrase
MAPLPRKTDKHLPKNVYYKNGSYYYVPRINGKKVWMWLAYSLEEALVQYAKLISKDVPLTIMHDIFDRYLREVAPLKAKKNYKTNIIQMAKLKQAFGHFYPDNITPVHIYQYMDKRASKDNAPVAANREKALLSHVFSMAIRWGAVKDNPCKHVKRIPEIRKKRSVSYADFLAVKNNSSEFIQCAMEFAYLTGLRKGDILSVKLTDITDDGIRVLVNKTSKTTGTILVFGWSPRLKKCIEDIKRLKRTVRGLYLFSNHAGQPYTADGFSTLWKRAMIDAVEKKLLPQRFRFHDIRHMVAEEAKQQGGMERARQLLGHEHQSTTAIYISEEQKVQPLK